ncbi:MAG: 16S rRNA (cytidine(1402)-2'-O)-methyltransferase [Bacillus subtilis]|nr:16S rRNA (cytidine(1402)-2'-O)-methyltransferase [Bacillus subtilis]
MERRQHYQNGKPTLFLIPTPIGNLGDMTFRAIETIKAVDVLYAEDTRVSQVLLHHFDIKKTLRSYHEHNKATETAVLVGFLREGKQVGLMTDAGMPIISDPGYEAAVAASQEGFNVVALPGANAALTGLSMSGIAPYPFLFYGFPDHKQGKRLKELTALADHTETIVFYEAPHRMKETLTDLYRAFGDRKAAVLREITKKFEEAIYGTLSELAGVDDWLGENVIVVSGASEQDAPAPVIRVRESVEALIREGLSRSDAMKQVAARMGVTKSVVYKMYLEQE